jgi:hypothetical protein
MADRRWTSRQRTLLEGKIIWHNLGAAIDCAVRDFSRTGACLIVESPFGIPDNFELMLDRNQSCYACRVIWRTAGRIGVHFEPTALAKTEAPLRCKD